MRTVNQNASTKVTAASSTVTFTPNDIPGDRVVAYMFLFTGAGMTVGDLTRIRIKAGGNTIWDVSFAHFQAWQQRFFPSNLAAAAADTILHVPLYLPDIQDEDSADVCQFPRGQAPTVELVIGAGGAAGTCQAAWIQTDVDRAPGGGSLVYPALYSNALNWSASTNNNRYPISEGGLVRGISINPVGLTRYKVVLYDRTRYQIEGTSLLLAEQRDRNVATIVDPIAHKIVGMQQAPPGVSYLEADLAAGWAGTANEAGFYVLRPQ